VAATDHLSGYLGQPESAGTVREAVAQAKSGSPGAIYLCDPVLGDDGRLYVNDAIVAEVRALTAIADIVTPNAFELGLLSGQALPARQDALRAMRALQASGPGIVLLTSFAGADTPADSLDVMAVDGTRAWRLNIPSLDQKFYGAGDLFAAIFFDAWLPRRDTAAAVERACSVLHAVLVQTAARRADELLLIETQHLFAKPQFLFVAELIV
jgi:pyridoxine kinase